MRNSAPFIFRQACLIVIFFLPLIFTACKSTQDPVAKIPIEKGVSLELAKHRKTILSEIHYDLALDIPDNHDSIRATEKLTFNLKTNESPLQLDFKAGGNLLRSIRINGKTAEIVLKSEHIVLPEKLLKKGKNQVEIRYICAEESLNRKETFLYSLFVPDRARMFMPCFDQPDLKATFKLTATVPRDWQVITNGQLVNEGHTSDKKTCYFKSSAKISTYLFTLVAGEFEHRSQSIDGRTINLYYRETDTAKVNRSVDSIFQLHALSLAFMEEYTGIPYPFEKFDVIAIPDFTYGGMEHAGAIDYRASLLFLDKTATQTEELDRLHVIAHETAHMWFGNLVTMEWFNDVWMKEVFANFMADKISSSLIPGADRNLQFLLEHNPGAYHVDRTAGAHPIRQELDNLNQAGSLYGEIIYQKAPIVLRQLEKTCGEEKLKEGLRKYLKQYSFGNADWSKLIAIMDEISPENLQEWNQQWINSGGMPHIDHSLEIEKGIITKLTLRQLNNPENPWKQHFSIALIYEDSIHSIPVYMNDSNFEIKEAKGLKEPLFIVFNSTGEGYGSFPADLNVLNQVSKLDAVMRATSYLNAYESVLNGEKITPESFLKQYAENFSAENEELILSRMTKQFTNIYWQFISDKQRRELHSDLENAILHEIKRTGSQGKKSILFRLFMSIAISEKANSLLSNIWSTQKNALNVRLSDEDYNALAGQLSLHKTSSVGEILEIQSDRIKDPDRKKRFEFIRPALSADPGVRDRFFESLSDPAKRRNEVWVSEALAYLHHPLRQGQSEKYLPKTLDLLVEIRNTGDIFFPTDWLRSSFAYYQSESVADIVRKFLKTHPDYNKTLKQKILQESDDLFRAEKILGKQEN